MGRRKKTEGKVRRARSRGEVRNITRKIGKRIRKKQK
jgi:hypothetical protein